MKKRLRTIIAAFCLSFALMVALSLFSIERFDKFSQYSDMVDHTNLVINNLYKIDGCLKDIDRAERGYILTHDTMYVRFLNNANDSVFAAINNTRSLTADNNVQQKNAVLLRSAFVVRLSIAREDLAYADSMKSSVPSAFYYQGRNAMLDCSKLMRAMHDEENKRLKERFEQEKIYQELTSATIRYLLFIFCVLTVGLFVIMIRELRSRIRFQDELQAKVIDLRRSHAELEQIAYVASHDLQEPLRKIQVFGNRITMVKKESLDEDVKQTMERINAAASRMQDLIEDLVNLTSLTNKEGFEKAVSLGIIVQNSMNDLQDKIETKQAVVHLTQLPTIHGNPAQLQILFKALIDNALKFAREGVKPVIAISSEVSNGAELMEINPKLADKKFNKLIFSDNGIGFDDQFIDKMFQIFQRLHGQDSEYDGKGIGLAICQRVMANHEGYIIAHGQPGMGATFKLFFPVGES